MRELSINDCMTISGGDDLASRLVKGGGIFVGLLTGTIAEIYGIRNYGYGAGMIGFFTCAAAAAAGTGIILNVMY